MIKWIRNPRTDQPPRDKLYLRIVTSRGPSLRPEPFRIQLKFNGKKIQEFKDRYTMITSAVIDAKKIADQKRIHTIIIPIKGRYDW